MNCCGCTPQAGITKGTPKYGRDPCLTVYDFLLLDENVFLNVPVTGLYEVSLANFGGNINKAAAGEKGTAYGIMTLSADSPLYINYGGNTVVYQGVSTLKVTSGEGSSDYRPGVKVRLIGTDSQMRMTSFTSLALALEANKAWRDTLYDNGRTMLDMSENRAIVPTRMGDWQSYPSDSRMVIPLTYTAPAAGEYKLYALSKTTIGVAVNGSVVQALRDNKGGAYAGYGALTAKITLKKGENDIIIQNANTTGKVTEIYTSFVLVDGAGNIVARPPAVRQVYERINDCSGSDIKHPRMRCWFYDINTAGSTAADQPVTLSTPGWYQIVVAASGQPVETAIRDNAGQGVTVFEAKAGDIVTVHFGDYVYANLPDGRVVESQQGDGKGKGAARLLFISKTLDATKTYEAPIGNRPSWFEVSVDPRMKFTRVVSGFPNMSNVPGNMSMYLVGEVTLEAGTYVSTTWGDDVSIVFLDGQSINRSVGFPGGNASQWGAEWGPWLGWDALVKEFTVKEPGTHQIIIFNMNVPRNTPGWSCFTIQDKEGNVLHEVNTEYFGLNTIYDCDVDEEE